MKQKKNKKPTPAAAPVVDYKTQHLNGLAAQIAAILESDKVSELAKKTIYSVAEEAIFNGEDNQSRADFIRERFARTLINSHQQYVIAVTFSLRSLFETLIDDEIYQPIFDATAGELELVEETINTADSEIEQAAAMISAFVNDPKLPERIRESVIVELLDIYSSIDQSETDVIERSPEYIAVLLRGLNK